MSEHNERSLKNALDHMLNRYHLKQKVSETRLIASWDKLMGPPIAKHTKKIFISKGRLFIYLDNAALKNELSYSREKIKKLLNEESGEELVQEVIIK